MENGSVPKSPNVVLPPPSVLPSSVVSFQSTIDGGWDGTPEEEEGEFETLIDGNEVHLPPPVKSSSMSEAVLRPLAATTAGRIPRTDRSKTQAVPALMQCRQLGSPSDIPGQRSLWACHRAQAIRVVVDAEGLCIV